MKQRRERTSIIRGKRATDILQGDGRGRIRRTYHDPNNEKREIFRAREGAFHDHIR